MTAVFLFCAINVLPDKSCAETTFDDPSTGTDAARAVGAPIANQLKSGDALKEKLGRPMANGEGQLTTLDGGVETTEPTVGKYITLKESRVQMKCKNAPKFLEILVTDIQSSGDFNIKIFEDTDLDGTDDYTIDYNRISGVCGNGIIMCDAGTWANCRHYGWVADGAGHVATQLVSSIRNLGGCYCINNRCGTNLVAQNQSLILRDLGAGMIGAIQTAVPNLLVGDSKTTPVTIEYYAQKSDQCTNDDGSATNFQVATADMPTQYFNPENPEAANIGQLEQDGNQLANVAATDETSAYHALPAAFRNATSGDTVTTCVFERTPGFTQGSYTHTSTPNMSVVMETSRTIALAARKLTPGVDDLFLDFVSFDSNGNVERIVPAATLPTPQTGAKLTSFTFNATSEQVGCTPGNAIDSTVTTLLNLDTTVPLTTCAGLHNVTINYNYTARYEWETFSDPLPLPKPSDCVAKLNDSHCSVMSDQVCSWTVTPVLPGTTNRCPDGYSYSQMDSLDGTNRCGKYGCYYLIMDFIPTGLSSTEDSCRDIVGRTMTQHICHDWWKRIARISCTSDCPSGYYWDSSTSSCKQVNDFSDLQLRSTYNANSISMEGGVLRYQDTRMTSSGGWVTDEIATTSVMSSSQPDSCIKICNVKITKTNSQAGTSGANVDYVNTNSTLGVSSAVDTTYSIVARQCIDDTCPFTADESLSKPCHCQTEDQNFAEVSSALEALNNASKDMICSDGVPK